MTLMTVEEVAVYLVFLTALTVAAASLVNLLVLTFRERRELHLRCLGAGITEEPPMRAAQGLRPGTSANTRRRGGHSSNAVHG